MPTPNSSLEIIKHDLRVLGLKPGDKVLVHSSLSSMGYVEGGADTVVTALKELIGQDGLLLFPALSHRTVGENNPFFKYYDSPACNGLIAEVFRRSQGVVRSLHPTHSVSAWGKNAEEIIRDHELDGTKVGVHSPFRRLAAYNGKILMLGCGLKPMTFMHGVEEEAELEFVHSEPVDFTVEDRHGVIHNMRVRNHGFFPNGLLQRYDRIAEIMGADMSVGTVHGAGTFLLSAKLLEERALSILKEKPYYFTDKATSAHRLGISTFYNSRARLLREYKEQSRKLAFKGGTADELSVWQSEVRAKLREVLGLHKLKVCEPKPQLLETVREDGYRREKYLIQTEGYPGCYVQMPFFVLVPDGPCPEGGYPCAVATHGHDSCGKLSVAGCDYIPEVRTCIEAYNYTYGTELVRRGYIVFIPDARGFGERSEFTDDEHVIGGSCSVLNKTAIALGLSLSGMWVWDLIRLIDYIQSRSDCDIRTLTCVGLSGGGYQTLMLSALDTRINTAVVSGYFYGIRDALLKMPLNCDCNYVPGLWNCVDMGDIGALISPRRLIVETGMADPLNGERGVANVVEQTAVTRQAYRLQNAEDNFVHVFFDGTHRWDGREAFNNIQYKKCSPK